MAYMKTWMTLLCLTDIIAFVGSDRYYDLVQKLGVRYDPGLRPVCEAHGTTDVAVAVALRQILFLVWNDCRLTWNNTEFGTDVLHLPVYRIWTPDISLFDSTSDEAFPGIKDYRVRIQHDGSILYQFPTVITSYCKLNVEYFPVDSQVCELVFTPWIYNGAEVRMTPGTYTGSGDIHNYQAHPGWIMNSFESKQTVNYYKCCPEPYIELRYYLHITRRHWNYTVTLVFPCILISFLPLIGFLIPVEYGEKISLQLTIVVSLAVFLMVLSTTLPPSSDAMPLLDLYCSPLNTHRETRKTTAHCFNEQCKSIYFAISLTLVCVSCAFTAGVINIHFKSNQYVNAWVKKYFFGSLARLLLVDTSTQTEEYGWVLLIPEMQYPIGNKENMSRNPLSVHFSHGIRPTLEADSPFPENDMSATYNGTVNLTTQQNDMVSAFLSTLVQQMDRVEMRFRNKEREEIRAQEWTNLATIVDRILFVVFFLFMFFSLIIVFPYSA